MHPRVTVIVAVIISVVIPVLVPGICSRRRYVVIVLGVRSGQR
jgi:hypothetical protein